MTMSRKTVLKTLLKSGHGTQDTHCFFPTHKVCRLVSEGKENGFRLFAPDKSVLAVLLMSSFSSRCLRLIV